MGEASSKDTGQLALGVALGLATLLALPFGLGQALLLAGGHIAPLPAAIVLAAAISVSVLVAWRAGGTWVAPLAAAAIVLVATAGSALIIDTSHDGQEYHFDAVSALAQGWNPYEGAEPEPGRVKLAGPLPEWAGHYPQGAWIPSALQVTLGLSYEAAKSQPLIILAALFLAVLGAGRRLGLGKLKANLVAVLAAANPIILVQLFSRLNDGMLGACLALMATFAALWLLTPSRWAVLGVVAPLILAVNLKFSGIPSAAGICALICAFALALRGWKPALRVAAILVAAGLVGVLVLGAHPYVTNVQRNGHPFYPLMGPGHADIMTGNRPEWFRHEPPIQRMAASYFGATTSGYAGDEHFKAPFTLERPEIRAAGQYDVRIGGFGPLFSGALVLALALGGACALQRPASVAATRLLAGAGGVLALAVIMPEAWWARYVPQIWWVAVLVALACLVSRSKVQRTGGWILAAVLIANAGLVGASSARTSVERTLDVRRQLAQMRREPGMICLYPSFYHARLSLLGDISQKIRIRKEPLKGCKVVPLAGTYAEWKAGYCPCP